MIVGEGKTCQQVTASFDMSHIRSCCILDAPTTILQKVAGGKVPEKTGDEVHFKKKSLTHQK